MPAANSFVTAEKEGGKGSSRASFANEEGNHKWYGLYQGSYGVPGHQQSLFIPGASTSAGHTRSSTSSSREVVIDNSSFIPGHQHSFVYTRSLAIPCLYQVIGDSLFIPGRSELFTPVAVVWGALLWPKYSRGAIPWPLHVWRLGEHDPRLWDDSGQRVSSNCPGSGMSTTVGGHSARRRAAASGRAASMASRVSGRAARSSG